MKIDAIDYFIIVRKKFTTLIMKTEIQWKSNVAACGELIEN